MDDYESNLPLNRQVEVMAASMGKKDKEPVAFASAMLGETWKEDEIEDPEDPGQFYPGGSLGCDRSGYGFPARELEGAARLFATIHQSHAPSASLISLNLSHASFEPIRTDNRAISISIR